MKKNVYATFDVFPSSKGASTHIQEMITEASNHCDELQLYCLRGNDNLPAIQKEKNILIKRYYTEEKLNYIQKASLFSQQLFLDIENDKKNIKIGHFRDIWSGMGLVSQPSIKTIFEVNAFTSIELPYRFSNLTPSFIEKIKTLEKQCLEKCTAIITPSKVTKNVIVEEYKIDQDKITVIPNGTHIPEHFEKPADAPNQYIIYFGAIQPWQGIDVLLKAMTYLKDFENLKLLICLSVKEKAFKQHKKMVEKLGLEDSIILKSKLSKGELYNYIHFAEASIAPLKACDRNLIQGCCPLKVLETMACKTPIIASDIPVIRELVSEKEALFFDVDREQDLARCIRFILDNPEKKTTYIKNAFKKVTTDFLWKTQRSKLQKIYEKLH